MARLDKAKKKLLAKISAARRAAFKTDARLFRFRKQRRFI
jgi:hypothetical protein